MIFIHMKINFIYTFSIVIKIYEFVISNVDLFHPANGIELYIDFHQFHQIVLLFSHVYQSLEC